MRLRRLAVLVVVALAAGCAPTIAGYQEQAYRNATTLKAESDALLAASATVRYPDAAARVDRVATDIDAAYNYASGLPKNSLSAAQWQKLRDGFFRPFVATWAARGTLGPAASREDAGQLDAAFDQIICLEANKRAATACAVTAGARP